MDDAFLRKAADAVVRGEQVIAEASKHLSAIREEIDRGEYIFTEMPADNEAPKATRALQATNKKGSSLLICQFNHEKHGIGHAGTAIRLTGKGPLIVNLPPDLADYIYHKAVGSRN